MTNKRIDVFISSTSRDLALHRDKVRDAVIARKMHPIMMEDFPAISRDAVDLCRAKVDEAQLFVGIYARRYGYCPNDGDKSITEMEYDWAEEDGIERLVFVLDEAHEWDDDHPIAKHADDDPRLKMFLGRIGTQIVYKTFTTPEDLALKVSQSLEAWEDGQLESNVNQESQPRGVWWWASLLLRVVIFIVIAFHGVRLFSADPSAFVETEGIIVILGGLLSLAFIVVPIPLPQWLLVGVLVILIPITFFGGSWALDRFGEQQVTDAIRAGDVNEAQTLLDSATRLDVDVEPRLQGALLEALNAPVNDENDERVTFLSRLYTRNIPADSVAYETMSAALQSGLMSAIEAMRIDTAQRYAEALARIDPAQASELAMTFNNTGVDALAGGAFDTARLYLETVRTIDETDNDIRTQTDQGGTLYNLGVLYEQDDSLSDNLAQAEDAYRAAIARNSDDYVTRYALASLLLVAYPDDADRLRDAVEIAERGQDALPEAACNITQSGGTADERWYCFLLMTTEAGARLALDDDGNAAPLVNRATRLAEANDHFGDGRDTAEAYYYFALLTEPDTPTATLCNIIIQRNPNIDRHQEWAQYASAQLGDTRCTP